MKKQYYITTPVYYVNGAPHIGHAYTQIACDSIARFLKQNGRDVFFMTGTDEHGEKIEKAALAEGLGEGKEKEFIDKIIPKFRGMWEKLNIKYDHFIRTTDEDHKNTVRAVLTTLNNKGDIYKKVYNGWFCTPCEMFWSESQAPLGICPDCSRQSDKLDEENYFFKMSSYSGKLIEYIESGKMRISPEMRKNEVLSFLKNNELQDLCISRPRSRLKWGIELPFDKDYVAYVWMDALINYISGAGYVNDRKKFNSMWPADIHMIGKDILRHHAVYWPIMLFAIDVEPPKKVFAHGWWVISGEKMSKSKGNIVDPSYLIDNEGYPVDALRYFLLSQVEFGRDGTFTEALFVEKYNSDLANDLGNLLNRALTMLEKYFEGIMPENGLGLKDRNENELGDEAFRFGKELEEHINIASEKVKGCMELEGNGPDFQGALKDVWALIGKANKYIEVSTPWVHSKNNNDFALSIIMNRLITVLGMTACLIYPFMPSTAENMWVQLGMERELNSVRYDEIKQGIVEVGRKIKKGSPLFPRRK